MNERTEVLLVGKSEIEERDVIMAMDFALEQVKSNLTEPTYQLKRTYSEEGTYHPMGNVNWTTGLWTGQAQLIYEWVKRVGDEVGAEALKAAGEIQIENFLERIEKKIEMDHHDIGFLYSPSCMTGFKLVGSEKGKEVAVKAAGQLISRSHPVGELIQAWGPMDRQENYQLTIDRLLNLPLLYRASKETGDEKYRGIAGKYLRTAVANVVREDYSIWHTFFTNMETGVPDHGATCQGYWDGFVWARGQAWGVYGMALAYRYTGRKEYTEDFKHATGYFLEHLSENLVPYWDLEFGNGSGEPRDSSSASIAVCGILKTAKYLEGDDATYYTGIVKKLMKSAVDSYAVKDQAESDGLVLHSTYSKRPSYNVCTSKGVDECNIWGDYFYMEASARLADDWNPYW